MSYGGRSAYARLDLPLSSLLDDLRVHKEKQRRTEVIQTAARRGAMLCVPLLLLLGWMWLHSGSDEVAGSRRMHCFFLIDRTGSMERVKPAVISGFNEFLTQQQKQPGSMIMTLALFNSANPFDVRFDDRDVHSVTPLDAFEPSGTTPLYDALAQLIQHAAAAERSSEREIVIAVFTDGKENASRRYSKSQVFSMIEQRRKSGWTCARARAPFRTVPPHAGVWWWWGEPRALQTLTLPAPAPPATHIAVVFLGANQNAFASAGGLAIPRGATSNYIADARGMSHGWADLSSSTSRARGVLRSGRSQTASERAEYLKGFDSAEQDYRKRKGRGLRHAEGQDPKDPAHTHSGRRRWWRRRGATTASPTQAETTPSKERAGGGVVTKVVSSTSS